MFRDLGLDPNKMNQLADALDDADTVREVFPERFDEFRRSVYKGLRDAKAGRGISDEELGKKLDRLFGPLPETDEDDTNNP